MMREGGKDRGREGKIEGETMREGEKDRGRDDEGGR